jgi:hypothetical protein
MPEQHDDHIWLTAAGEAWAIRAIRGERIYLWRGYAPNLQYCILEWPPVHWSHYADHAAQLLSTTAMEKLKCQNQSV